MGFLKPDGNVSSRCQGEVQTMPSIIVHTSLIFCTLLDVRPHMCRLSQVLHIECKPCMHQQFK